MKKAFIIPLLFVCSFSIAQLKSISLTPVVTNITGTYKGSYNLGYGGLIKYEQQVSRKVDFYSEIGVIASSSKNSFYKNDAVIIPVTLGFRFLKIVDEFNIGLGAGISNYSFSKNIYNGIGFTVSPSIGYDFDKVLLNVSYNGTSKLGSLDYLAFKLYFKIK